jgi:drug/metabolite transporter (DMT)-like permease
MKILTLALLSGTAGNLLINGGGMIAAVRVMPSDSWLQVLYLATICTAIGYAIWFVVIKETDVNVTALTIFMQPVAGVAIAWLWLHEPLHWGQFWGSVAIVAGLIVGLSRQVKVAPVIQKPASIAPQVIDK